MTVSKKDSSKETDHYGLGGKSANAHISNINSSFLFKCNGCGKDISSKRNLGKREFACPFCSQVQAVPELRKPIISWECSCKHRILVDEDRSGKSYICPFCKVEGTMPSMNPEPAKPVPAPEPACVVPKNLSYDYEYNCIKCGKRLVSERKLAGSDVECPGCRQSQKIPSNARQIITWNCVCGKLNMVGEEQKGKSYSCPFCGNKAMVPS